MRTCIEVEANFKAILRENAFTPIYNKGDKKGRLRTEEYWNINDYRKINKSHHLYDYFAEFPFWRGTQSKYQPFASWQSSTTLPWYQAYNVSKHDRDNKFESANFENLLNAFTGLFILVCSQFNDQSFIPGPDSLVLESGNDNYFGGEFGIGDYLKIEFPTNWSDSEKYDFDWSVLQKSSDKFQKFNYNSIS